MEISDHFSVHKWYIVEKVFGNDFKSSSQYQLSLSLSKVRNFGVSRRSSLLKSPMPKSNSKKVSHFDVNVYLCGITISAQEVGFPKSLPCIRLPFLIVFFMEFIYAFLLANFERHYLEDSGCLFQN